VERISSGSAPIAPPTAEEVKEAVTHQDDKLPISFLRLGLQAATGVAKLMVPRYDAGVRAVSGGTPVTFLGTGWLIARGILITNHHVVNARLLGEPPAGADDLRRQALETVVQFESIKRADLRRYLQLRPH
jgi:hypothetical protein